MAIGGRYPSQRPFVGTQTQAELIDLISGQLQISKASVMREALNRTFGLTTGPRDGEVPRGHTMEELVKEGVALLGGEVEDEDADAGVLA